VSRGAWFAAPLRADAQRPRLAAVHLDGEEPVNKYRLHLGASAGRADATGRDAGDAVSSSRIGNAALPMR